MNGSTLRYLNEEALEVIDPQEFRNRQPYPWINPQGLLTKEGRQHLLETLPDVSGFEPQFGIPRSHGQKSHDRWSLCYRDDLRVAAPWREFIAELRGPVYRRFLHRLFGPRPLWLSFYWQYAPRGASVSPHCDAKRKLGSHIFYLNREGEWNESWGGQTLILDDEGRFSRESAPGFDQFHTMTAARATSEFSLLFARRGNSWHGVRELTCPEGSLRKIFLVVVDDAVLSAARRVFAPIRGKRALQY